MNALTAWFASYWQYAVALVLVAAGTVFVCAKAARAYKAHQTRFHEEEAAMRRLSALRERYRDLTEDVIAAAPKEELLEGVALRTQLWVQKQPDMKRAFAALPKELQYVYALGVFLDDKTPTQFFTQNSSPLLQVIAPAFEAIGLRDALSTVRRLALMFDETDESTSVDRAFLAEAEKSFSERDLLTQIKLAGAEYIQSHAAVFLADSLTE